jgi:hypothetical protein
LKGRFKNSLLQEKAQWGGRMVSTQVIGANSAFQLKWGLFETKPFYKNIESETCQFGGSSAKQNIENPARLMRNIVGKIERMKKGEQIREEIVKIFCQGLFSPYQTKEGKLVVSRRAFELSCLLELAKRKVSGSGELQVDFLKLSYPYNTSDISPGKIATISIKPNRGKDSATIVLYIFNEISGLTIEIAGKNNNYPRKKIKKYEETYKDADGFAKVLNELILPYLYSNKLEK